MFPDDTLMMAFRFGSVSDRWQLCRVAKTCRWCGSTRVATKLGPNCSARDFSWVFGRLRGVILRPRVESEDGAEERGLACDEGGVVLRCRRMGAEGIGIREVR